VVAELGSLARFETPRQLMGYSGMVSREYTSGNRVQRGAITKSGNAHLRRVLVEAAWTYRHRPNVQGRVLRRQKSLALSEEAKRIAWKAQQPLSKRFTALARPGERKQRDRDRHCSRVARVHVGHCRTHRIAVSTSQSHSGLINPRDVFLDSSADDGRGPTKRRTLEENCAVRSADPTRDLSPRQLPTDHVHAVPTREYHCDQSSR
jgi:hypothetical protein